MVQLKIFPVYCIDASSLFDLKRWYPMDRKIFAPIWIKINNLIKKDLLISHVEVQREIRRGRDELVKWATKNRSMFKNIDEEQLRIYAKVKKKYDKDYWDRETSKSVPWGDPWIITLAISTKATIVTNENKVKPNRIPFIAKQFGVHSLNLLEFFKEISIK